MPEGFCAGVSSKAPGTGRGAAGGDAEVRGSGDRGWFGPKSRIPLVRGTEVARSLSSGPRRRLVARGAGTSPAPGEVTWTLRLDLCAVRGGGAGAVGGGRVGRMGAGRIEAVGMR